MGKVFLPFDEIVPNSRAFILYSHTRLSPFQTRADSYFLSIYVGAYSVELYGQLA